MDANILEELYHKYYRSAVLYCIGLCGIQQLAEDIATDAFVKAYLYYFSIKQFNNPISPGNTGNDLRR